MTRLRWRDQPPARGSVTALPVSLFADPTTVAGDRVELFLVNLTTATVGVPAQDNDLYAKLEGSTRDRSVSSSPRCAAPASCC